MGKRIVIEDAEHCPFCGATKIFLKACTEGVSRKRFAVSLQCSKCHVHGPQVFSELKPAGLKGIGDFKDLPDRDALIAAATEKWNTRF